MAEIKVEPKGSGSILPWLFGLAVLILIVGWMLWRNNRLPAEGQGSVWPAHPVVAVAAA